MSSPRTMSRGGVWSSTRVAIAAAEAASMWRRERFVFMILSRANIRNLRARTPSDRHMTSARWLIALLTLGTSAGAQQAPRLFQGAPVASWIAPAGAPGDAYTVFHARRTFDVPAVPARFVVHVSADNRYRLYVNAVTVASGPQRSDVTHWRYETVDLAPRLRAGRNVIAALVWNWGPARPVAQHSVRTGFLLQGDGPAEAAANTGPGWRLVVDSA